jgi:hypothetical protein
MSLEVGYYGITPSFTAVVAAGNPIGYEFRVKSRSFGKRPSSPSFSSSIQGSGGRRRLVGTFGSPPGSTGIIQFKCLAAGVWIPIHVTAVQNIATVELFTMTDESVFGIIEPVNAERYRAEVVTGPANFVNWRQDLATPLEIELLDYVGP